MSSLERVQQLSQESKDSTVRVHKAILLTLASAAFEIGATIKHSTIVQIVSGAALLGSLAGVVLNGRAAGRKGTESEVLFNSLGIDGPNPYPTYMSPHIRSESLKKTKFGDPYVFKP